MGFTWQEEIKAAEETFTFIKPSQYQELHDNVDWLKDNPGCGANNLAVDTGQDATVNTTADNSADTGDDVTVNASQNGSAYGGNKSGVDINNFTGYNLGRNVTI